MIPSHYAVLGHYASLTRRLEKITGGTAAAKKARADAIAAIKTHQEALIAAHRKLSDAVDAYEADAAQSVCHVNRALSGLRSSALPGGTERPVEAAMQAGAHHLDQIHHLLCDVGGGPSDIISTATDSNSSHRRSMK